MENRSQKMQVRASLRQWSQGLSSIGVVCLALSACVAQAPPVPQGGRAAVTRPAPTTVAKAAAVAGDMPAAAASASTEGRCQDAREPLRISDAKDVPKGSLLWRACSERLLPLLVVTHGAGGGPAWHCEFWKQHVGQDAHLLCLRGRLIDRRVGETGGHFYPEHLTLARWIDANLEVALAILGARGSELELGLVGYSQGATMGSLAIGKTRHHFRAAILSEGGFEHWSLRRARALRDRDLKFVALSCGTSRCANRGRRVVELLRQAEVRAQLHNAPGVGHRPDSEVGKAAAKALKAAWPLLFLPPSPEATP